MPLTLSPGETPNYHTSSPSPLHNTIPLVCPLALFSGAKQPCPWRYSLGISHWTPSSTFAPLFWALSCLFSASSILLLPKAVGPSPEGEESLRSFRMKPDPYRDYSGKYWKAPEKQCIHWSQPACPTLLCTGAASPQVVCAVLGTAI